MSLAGKVLKKWPERTYRHFNRLCRRYDPLVSQITKGMPLSKIHPLHCIYRFSDGSELITKGRGNAFTIIMRAPK